MTVTTRPRSPAVRAHPGGGGHANPLSDPSPARSPACELLAPVASASPTRTDVTPLPRAHAHNDYEHARPLLDALDHGFTSVEADVWLVDGELPTWRGVGPMPADEHARLHRIVGTAHAHGYGVRFWETPDVAGPARDAVWGELLHADVDQINTDDLPWLQAFLTTRG